MRSLARGLLAFHSATQISLLRLYDIQSLYIARKLVRHSTLIRLLMNHAEKWRLHMRKSNFVILCPSAVAVLLIFAHAAFTYVGGRPKIVGCWQQSNDFWIFTRTPLPSCSPDTTGSQACPLGPTKSITS